VGVEPYCWVDTWVHPALVQAPAGVLNLVKDPVEAGGTAGFVKPGCVDAAAVVVVVAAVVVAAAAVVAAATAAAAS